MKSELETWNIKSIGENRQSNRRRFDLIYLELCLTQLRKALIVA